jgi:hypothetical protein
MIDYSPGDDSSNSGRLSRQVSRGESSNRQRDKVVS